MHYHEFIRFTPSQPDADIQAIIDLIKQDEAFPINTSDPRLLSKYIYLKLNHRMTTAFQKTLIIYSQMPANMFPEELKSDPAKMLKAINSVVDLQNKDKNYPWK